MSYSPRDGRSPGPGTRGPAADRADGLPSVRPGAGRPSSLLPGWPDRLVKLSVVDRELAEKCAAIMLANAHRHRMEDRFGEESRRSHYLGAIGEIGFARFLGVEWSCHPKDTGGRPDVGGYEVRACSADARELYVKSKSNDRPGTRIAAVAILAGRDVDNVMSREAAVLVMGWITAAQLRERGRYRDPGGRVAGAYFLTGAHALGRHLETDDWRPWEEDR